MTQILRPDFQRERVLRWRHHVPPRPGLRSRRRRLSDTQTLKLLTVLGALALGWLVLRSESGTVPTAPAPPLQAESGSIDILDGDTVRSGGYVYRLVGFNTPESGFNAGCGRERALASKATARLRELVGEGTARLDRVSCACPAGTEGTDACNHGRRCGRLMVGGRDVAPILIGESLAERYVCRATACPPRKDWCAS